jgi:hypothetical protein
VAHRKEKFEYYKKDKKQASVYPEA